jgi:hypothetical protein
MTTLSRRPSTPEMDRMTNYMKRQRDPRTGYTDILWTLLNCSEFRFNH